MPDLWVAVIMGIVEGLTEFVPVSSTGHLIIAGHLLHFSGQKAACFEVFIQLGAILAVVVLYWKRLVALIPWGEAASNSEHGFAGWYGLSLLALTTLPALIVGFFAHGLIKAYLFKPATVAWALGLGGVAILVAERIRPATRVTDLDQIRYRHALLIGLFQCLAMWPGISRSAATIVGGLLSGLHRHVAAEYSFLAAIPVMIAATSYDLYRNWSFLEKSDALFFAVGFIVSFVSALIAVKTFIGLVQKWSLAPYAWYRIAVAPVIYIVWS